MDNRKCVVILYSNNVVDSAALAVAEYLEIKHAKDIYVCLVSDDELSPWKYVKMRKRSYRFASRNFPILNKYSYGLRHLFTVARIKKSKREYHEFKRPTEGIAAWWFKIGAKYRRVYNVLGRFEPDLVLCMTAELLTKANKAKHDLDLINMSVCALTTDYQLDKNLVHHKTDGYFVQNESIKMALAQLGIEEDSITVVGTPTSTRAREVFDRESTLTEYGITLGKLNIIILGGRYGSAKVKEIFSRCIEFSSEYNIILLTGESDSISKYCTYAATSKKKSENIYIIEKVDEMAKIYSIADIIITTPTAQITYEAMLHGKKLIVLKGCDKLENLNAHYLTTNGLALHGVTPDEVTASLFKYLEDEEFSRQVAKAQSEFVKPNSSEELGELILAAASVHYEAKQDIQSKREQIMNESTVALAIPIEKDDKHKETKV